MQKDKFQICISISSSPGSFGETVHNSGYKSQKINYFYKALKVKDLKSTMNAVRTLNIKGCSVSMPFKEKVIKYLDRVDHSAKRIGAVNTILNKNDTLIGFNTDEFGALKALSSFNLKSSDSILILGAGGVSRAIICALKRMKILNITICNRNIRKSKKIANLFKCKFIKWNERNHFKNDILINATSVGMKTNEGIPLKKQSIRNFKKVMDVVVRNEDTDLIKEAKKLNLNNISGITMTFYQAAEQYKIYTGYNAPVEKMLNAYNKKNNLNIKI